MNTGKVLVAVLAMIMLFAGITVALADDASAETYADTDALQTALNAEGATEVTLSNQITLDKDLTIPEGVTLKIDNNGRIVVAESYELIVNGIIKSVRDIDGKYKPTTVMVNGTMTSNNPSGGVYIGDGITTEIGAESNGTDEATVEKIAFSNFAYSAINVSGSGPVAIENCSFTGTGAAASAIYVEGEVTTITMTNCSFDGAYSNATLECDLNTASKLTKFAIESKDASEVSILVNASTSFGGDDGVYQLGDNVSVSELKLVTNSSATPTPTVAFKESMDIGTVSGKGNIEIKGQDVEINVQTTDLDGIVPTTGYNSESYVASSFEGYQKLLSNTVANDVVIDKDLVIPTGETLSIESGDTLTIEGATITRDDATGLIEVKDGGTLILDGADVYVPVKSGDKATVVLKNTKSYTISNGTITSPIEVGYGNTVNAESITVQSGLRIDVYGNFNVAGSLRITDGTFTVYQGGTATVSGNLNIASNAVIDGVLNVNSNVTVQGSGSPATFTVGATGEVNVASGATFTVARGNTQAVNTLTIETDVENQGQFNVEGTLAMNGTLSGAVNAYGTVQMNGVIATGGATVNLFDQTSITVTSISGGILTITDGKAATDYAGDLAEEDESNLSQGNSVKLTPGTSTGTSAATIGGITVSVEVTQFVYEGDGYYISDMTIGGTIVSSAKGGKVDIIGATGEVYYNADAEKRTGYIYVNDMALSAGTALTFENGNVFVEGTLDATANDTDKKSASVTISAGTVTVNGMIKTRDTNTLTQNINAGHYTTLVNTDTVNNYVNADAAIAAIGEAQMNQVNFYGETTVTVDATIPANALVTIEGGAVLNVDAVLTIADNAYVTITDDDGIVVKDTLVVTNYLATVNNAGNIKADVMTQSGDDRTYMSLAAAMASGATEIVLNQTVTVSEDLTIPEGVTITSDQYGFKVEDDVTLTVDGAIELTGRNNKIVLAADADNDGSAAELVVNGHVSYAAVTTDPLATVEGAHFQKKVDGLNTQFISNVGYAAENCSEGIVTIYGNVTAGDVTFTAAENKPLTIVVANISATDKSTLTVGTLTLVGATLDLCSTTGAPTDGYGTVTGTVAVSASDAVVGSVDADRATGFKLAAGSETTAEGTTYYAYLTGTVTGDVTVSAGTVTVGPAADDVTLTVAADSTLTVASGATLALADEMTVETAAGVTGAEDDAVLTVDGTITVGEKVTLTIKGDAVVNGTMDVLSTEDGKGTVIIDKSTSRTTYAGTLDVAGAVTVGTYNDNDAIFNVKGVMSVGAKPTSLEAAGSVGSATGTYTIEAGAYVKVYNGADVAGAEFSDGSTEAVSTVYYINGYEYMTVYANGEVNVYTVIDAEVFEISGIKNGVNFEDNTGNTGLYLLSSWFTSESMAANTVLKDTDKVGKVSAVYTEADAADVIGTVSEGDGLTLYIDNVPISASSAKYPLSVGTHTVAFTVQAGYNGDNAAITFNGQTVQSGGSITITADMDTFTLTVTGAVPATSGGSTGSTGGDDGMGLTDYLLIILVVLIVIMAVIVALRLMRS